MKCFRLIVFFLLAGLLSGCFLSPASAPAADGTPWPTRGWQLSTPEKEGMDPARLEEMQAAIKDQHISLHSLLIIRNGRIVSETYYSENKQNTLYELYSVTKSFTSTLTGIALDQGKLNGVDQKVVDLLPGRTFANLDARKQSMTLEDLLTMTSGLDWEEGDPIYRAMYMSADWVKLVMDLPMAIEPGKTFLYCSGCSHIISAILQERTGDEERFARQNLFTPLGITGFRWEKDRQGNLVGGWGLSLTARDMAKLGYLYLHNGTWEGKQVVSAGWVRTATAKHVATDGNLGYGYQWWTYPTHDAYAALGRYGQTIFVAPGLDLVVVTTAPSLENHDPIFRLIDQYILPAVLGE